MTSLNVSEILNFIENKGVFLAYTLNSDME
jgi:hypothetical protein